MRHHEALAARRLFAACKRVKESRREGFLRRVCAGDEALEHEVRELLVLDLRSDAFLKPPTVLDATAAAGAVAVAVAVRPTTASATAVEPGTLLGGRYLVRAPLDEGGAGTVYEATDSFTGSPVAVKVVAAPHAVDLARVRREVATLRWLRLPGVVRLLDDGADGERGWIAMERVRGEAFPGIATPASWEAIRRQTVALLETLARIHWAGVIHGDLKPSNVLVTDDGLPVVLDLGLSTGPEVGNAADMEGMIAGTPRYLAPERMKRQPADVASDLYAVGVMLYEALAGEAPHEDARTWRELFAARTTRPAAPLLSRAPSVPRSLAYLVDRLLEVDPAARPPSARDALALLQPPAGDVAGAVGLPWLGPRREIDALVDAARAGRSIDLTGPVGSGRSRCLAEAAAAIEREGRGVVRLGPGTRPFESLRRVLGEVEPAALDSAERAQRAMEWRLSARLASGDVLLADDAEGLDRLSAAALEACRGAGTVWRAFQSPHPEERALAPLPPEALEPLFAGRNRIHHVPEDAARELHARTGGLPSRVAAEIAAWERAGLARREGERWVITRDAIERLRAGLWVVAHAAPATESGTALDPALDDVRVAIDLAGRSASLDVLSRALERPPWLVDADIDELVRVGAARRNPDGTAEAATPSHGGASWPPERRMAVHAVLAAALPYAAPERVYHLLAAGRTAEVPAAALAAAEHLRLAGRPDPAIAVATEGLRCARVERDPALAGGLLLEMLMSALQGATDRALDQVLHEVQRFPHADPIVAGIEAVARAGLRALEWDSARAMESMEAVGVLSPPALERSRLSVLVLAARQAGSATEERVVAGISRRAAEDPASARDLPLEDWIGWLRYNQGRFSEAGEMHARCAKGALTEAMRASALVSASSAFLEAHELQRAEALATEALSVSTSLRLAMHEARAWRILRAVLYRRGDDATPDEDLVAAASALGNPNHEAMIDLNEAAIAWRGGRLDVARAHAERAADLWERSGRRVPRLLARGLAALCGGAWPKERSKEAVEAAREETTIPRAGLQLLGIAARLDPASTRVARSLFDALLARVPAPERPHHREILSVQEAVSWFGEARRAPDRGDRASARRGSVPPLETKT